MWKPFSKTRADGALTRPPPPAGGMRDAARRPTRTTGPGKRRIIGALTLAVGAALLAGCGVVRVTYSQGPSWVAWWLDGYFDFDDEQSQQVRAAVDAWFAWHRRTQLPDYAELLARLQLQATAVPVTPAAVCGWQDEVTRRADAAVAQALPPLAELALTLTPAQIRHLERRYAKNDDTFRAGYLQPDPQRRARAALERMVDRAEKVYGRFDDAQRERLKRGIDASPFDPAVWLAERQARQQDVLRTLRGLQANGAPVDPAEALATLRGAVDGWTRSPRPAYAAYQQRLKAYNCAFAAQVHNATTPAQRQHARDKLKGWEDDARALAK